MATRAALVAGRRAAGQGGLALLSSSGCSYNSDYQCAKELVRAPPHRSSSAAEREGHADATAAQVESALNRKNADVVDVDRSGSATLVLADARRGAGDEWVPDQETGVFVPADEASSGPGDGGAADIGGARGQAPSVLDQAVFVREEHMEDVERPAVGVDDAGTA